MKNTNEIIELIKLFGENNNDNANLEDLNIIHQVEKTLSELEQQRYCELLIGVVNKDMSIGFGPDGEIKSNTLCYQSKNYSKKLLNGLAATSLTTNLIILYLVLVKRPANLCMLTLKWSNR